MSTKILTLYKQPGEARLYSFDFTDQVEVADNLETLTGTPTVTASLTSGSGTLTVGTPSIVHPNVNFTLSGGTESDRHRILCTVLTSAGRTLQSAGELRITYST